MNAGRGKPETVDGQRRWWGVGVFTWGLGLAALIQLADQASRLGALPTSLRWQLGLGTGAVVLLATGAFLVSTRTRAPGAAVDKLWRFVESLAAVRPLGLALSFAVLVVLPLGVHGFGLVFLSEIIPRLLVFWLATLAASILLRGWFPHSTWEARVLGVAVGYGLLLRVLLYVPEISTYPFSLSWSEGSRYYYASLFHAESIYGVRQAPSELHPTRYLLQSIPFLIQGTSLWMHRLWQVFLWWLLPILTGWLLVRRYRLEGFWLRAVVAGWVVLYLFQGPMQYHLLVMVAVVLIGVRSDRPARSLAFILVASIWAGVSRLNWFPVPAILGGSLYLLDLRPTASWKQVVRGPFVWLVLGTATALASQAVYVRATGLGYERFTSSLFSDLLIYRLFPNPTFAWGILPALLLASSPLVVTIWRGRKTWGPKIGRPTLGFVAASLLVLGAGGLAVSLKIGGGSNLHNLDGFLVLLLLVGFALRSGGESAKRFYQDLPPFGELALLVAVPIIFAVSLGLPWVRRDVAAARESLQRLSQEIETASERGKKILFISQRHLLTFGMIEGVALEPEFETVFLMEMAMSGNAPYLERFETQLRDHAYDVIVAGRVNTNPQGPTYEFGEENDAWVRSVATPILEYYRLDACFEGVSACLYVPR